MSEDFVLSLISGVGFPAAVSFYLLARVSNSIDKLTRAITRLETRIESL